MVNRALEAITAAMMLATVVIAFAAVVYRYLLQDALSWSYEALLALLTHMTFVSAYLALRRGAHLKIDVLVRMLPVGGQAALFVFNQLVIAGVALVMVVWGAEQAWKFAARNSLLLEIPLGLLYGIIPLSGVGMLFDSLLRIPAGLARARRGLPPEDEGAVAPDPGEHGGTAL